MRIKTYLTVRECAELAQEFDKDGRPNTRRMRRRLATGGALVKLPGYQRTFVVPSIMLREAFPHLWAHAVEDSRFWAEACNHPKDARQKLVPGIWWCRGCGAHDAGEGWVFPAVTDPDTVV